MKWAQYWVTCYSELYHKWLHCSFFTCTVLIWRNASIHKHHHSRVQRPICDNVCANGKTDSKWRVISHLPTTVMIFPFNELIAVSFTEFKTQKRLLSWTLISPDLRLSCARREGGATASHSCLNTFGFLPWFFQNNSLDFSPEVYTFIQKCNVKRKYIKTRT